MSTRTRPAALAAATAFALAALTGCGAMDPNKGGDTTCGDYMEMAPEDQR